MLPQPHLVAKLFFSARGGGSQSDRYNICYIYRSGGSYRPFIVIEVNCSIYRDIDFRPYRPALVVLLKLELSRSKALISTWIRSSQPVI